MAKTQKLTPITILSIVDNGSGEICIEFNKEKVVEFKDFINQVFKGDGKHPDGQIQQAPIANRYPMYPDGQPMPSMPQDVVSPVPDSNFVNPQPPYHAMMQDIKNEAMSDFGVPPMPSVMPSPADGMPSSMDSVPPPVAEAVMASPAMPPTPADIMPSAEYMHPAPTPSPVNDLGEVPPTPAI